MTDRHRSFTVAQRGKEPLSFDIEGSSFQCRPRMASATLLKYFQMIASGDGLVSAGAILAFFGEAMEDEEHHRFTKFIEDPDVAIPIETLGEILRYLVEEYVGRPFGQQPSSESGPSSIGDISMGALDSPPSTPKRSPRTRS